MTEWPALLPWIPLWRQGRDVSKGHSEEWWGHPVCASSPPAFSADLHKHHFTAQWETHLKPRHAEKIGAIKHKSDTFTDQNVSQAGEKGHKTDKRLYSLKKHLWWEQPDERYCTYKEGLSAPARYWRVGLGVVMRSCVHVNVHLHLVVQDLHKLLHGG